MRRDERRRRFHEAIIKILYPPSPLPPQPEDDGEKPLDKLPEGVDDQNPSPDADDFTENSSSASDDDDECTPQKLTRAQRKRLRRNKLKENASRLRKFIGPQLPSPSGGDLENKPPKITRSAEGELVGPIEKPDNAHSCTSQNKVKQRRRAKRVARERGESSSMENCKEDGYLHGPDGCVT